VWLGISSNGSGLLFPCDKNLHVSRADPPYAALHSRLRTRLRLEPVRERERFAELIAHAFKGAGCPHTLLADSGLELLRQASQGFPRQAGRILQQAMELAVPKGINHLPDDLIQQAIEALR
jgi:MSHA biogenesis protein MshM